MPRGRAAHQGRPGARHLHPAVLLARAHEAGRHVSDVPRRGRGHARAADLRARRRSPTAWSSTRQSPGGEARPRTACSSSCSSTTRSTVRSATVVASARCRTRRWRSVPASRASSRRSGTSRSRSRSADLVLLDRERCIQCGRCTRFAAEIAGDALIDFGERGGAAPRSSTYPDEPFSSYFSGNTVQICPVGALTAKPYRFQARPWDLDSVETSCQTCAVGCRGALESTSQPARPPARRRPRPGEPGVALRPGPLRVRVGARRRSRHPSDGAARRRARRSHVARGARRRRRRPARCAGDARGPDSIGVLGGARGTNEDAYVWARFAKGVLGTDNVDAQLDDGLPAEVVARPARGDHRRSRRAPRRSSCSRPTSRRRSRCCTCGSATPSRNSASRSSRLPVRERG